MLTPKDQDGIWDYANPRRFLFTPEYWLALKDTLTGELPHYRELELMLERHGCIDAPLP